MSKSVHATILAIAATTLVNHAVYAQDLNVYGLGHVSSDRVDNGQGSSFFLASNSSRLGFSGGYDLTSGLEVFFQYETGLDLTAQGGNDGNGGASSDGQIFTKGRPSFVGIRGKFGQFLVGHTAALDQWANDYNLFADQVGDLGNLWEGSGVPGRVDNAMQFSTADFNGFNLVATYVPEEGANDADHLLLKANYSRGALKFGFAHASIGQGTNADEHFAQAITIGYYFDGFSLGGGYQIESDIAGISGADRDSFSIGGSFDVGPRGRIKVQLATSAADEADSDALLFAIGYDYAFDEHTTLYAAYARMDNDNNVNFSVNGKGHGDKVTPALGDDPNVLSIGIVYQFNVSLNGQ